MYNLRYKLSQFMIGRYGMDEFNKFLGFFAFILIVIGMFLRVPGLDLLILLIIIYMYFRVFSKNISKRSDENRRYLGLTYKLRNSLFNSKKRLDDMKTHHIYKCPTCKQKIRVPRGKGRIEISCPKCNTKFIKNS
ncbi:MAG: hypothetical protein K6B28_03965 [Lachnospiraceae bacterium]|nr:hypothetical protein [Lachnospiraceae bacterium]